MTTQTSPNLRPPGSTPPLRIPARPRWHTSVGYLAVRVGATVALMAAILLALALIGAVTL